MNYAIITGGIVTNIIIADAAFAASIGAVPAQGSGIGWSYAGGVFTPPAPPTVDIAVIRAAMIKQIDADTDVIYGAVQGNRGPEYIRAEAEATAYKQAGYTGTVPPSVSSWANAKGWTATQATDDILATAAGWRSAQESIRATRLLLKEQARTTNDVQAVAVQWSTFLATIKAALSIT